MDKKLSLIAMMLTAFGTDVSDDFRLVRKPSRKGKNYRPSKKKRKFRKAQREARKRNPGRCHS